MVTVTKSHQSLTTAKNSCASNCAQVIEMCGEKIGAGNETRTRDPDLGKIVPQRAQVRVSKWNSGFSQEVRNAQLDSNSSDLRRAAIRERSGGPFLGATRG